MQTSASPQALSSSHSRPLWFGADYYPEQWPDSLGDEDMRLMAEAGVSMVSVGVFAWGLIERRPGEFDWGWFDRLVDRLHAHGIAASLGTMTASPPSWLARAHPEILPVTVDGLTLSPGARQHFCPSSPIYREHAVRFVSILAERYREHPAIRLWHVGNEYGCHVAECYCDVSAAAFRTWLRQRYGDVDAINDAWTTQFWSQNYEDIDEILPPRTAPLFSNHSQRLDYARFSSDEMLACFMAERDVLRRATPEVPISTNFLSWGKPVDLFRWAEELDIVGHDAYQDPAVGATHVDIGFAHDLMRCAKPDAPFYLAEQSPGVVNWRERNTPKAPGRMALWSWQAVAQGADCVLSFQWRQSRGGAEKFHSGVVPHTGERSRIFTESRELGAGLAQATDIVGSRVDADVAIVMDWANWWSVELDAHPTVDLDYHETLVRHYAPFFERSIAVDVVPPGRDLSGYRLVVVPNLYLVSEDTARWIENYVSGGGTLVVSFFSGIVDEHDRVHLGGYGGPLRATLGLTVEEHWPLQPDESVSVEGHPSSTATVWTEDVALAGAEPVARFASGPFCDGPAITSHRFGAGTAVYLATRLDDAALERVLVETAERAGVQSVLPGAPPGVQATIRRGDEIEHLFLLNHSDETKSVPLDGSWRAAIPVGATTAAVELAPYGVAVLQRPAGR